MLGMVTPEVLQMPNIRQAPATSQPPFQDGAQNQFSRATPYCSDQNAIWVFADKSSRKEADRSSRVTEDATWFHRNNTNTNMSVNIADKTSMPQLAPEVESVLLQQVMNLTAEQLSSLPPRTATASDSAPTNATERSGPTRSWLQTELSRFL